jgi:hypothetical protein
VKKKGKAKKKGLHIKRMASERKKGIVIFLPNTTDNTNILKIIRLEKTIKSYLSFFLLQKRRGKRNF